LLISFGYYLKSIKNLEIEVQNNLEYLKIFLDNHDFFYYIRKAELLLEVLRRRNFFTAIGKWNNITPRYPVALLRRGR